MNTLKSQHAKDALAVCGAVALAFLGFLYLADADAKSIFRPKLLLARADENTGYQTQWALDVFYEEEEKDNGAY